MAAMSSPQSPQRVAIVVPARTILVVLAFAALVALVLLSLGTLLSLFVASVFALALDPVVDGLVRNRGWRRGRAALAVFFGTFIALFLIVAVAVGPLWRGVRDLAGELPGYWDELKQTDLFDALMTSGMERSVSDAAREVAGHIPDAASTLLGVTGGLFGSVLSVVTLSFMALYLMMERPAITDWVFSLVTPDAETRWRPATERAIRAMSSTMLGNLAISLVAAMVAYVSALIFGLPFPAVLAVIVGLLDLIPMIGATIAAIILALVALTVSTKAVVGIVIIQLIYQQIENYVVAPIVYSQAVDLSPLTTVVAVLIAAAILGVVGAILAVPFAAVIKIALDEYTRPRREAMAALRELGGAGAGAS